MITKLKHQGALIYVCTDCHQAWQSELQQCPDCEEQQPMPRRNKRKKHYSEKGKQVSKVELDRGALLELAQKRGIIHSLVSQPEFTLLKSVPLKANAMRPKSVTQLKLTYTPDYAYTYQGVDVVEDVKGAKKSGKSWIAYVTPSARKSHKLFNDMFAFEKTFIIPIRVNGLWRVFYGSNKRHWMDCPLEAELYGFGD